MGGLEKIKSQILEEANQSAGEMIAQAKAKAADILVEARAEAEKEEQQIVAESVQSAARHQERIASSCDMRRRQAVLAAKQELISDVLQKAYERVIHLPDEDYFGMLRDMLREYVQPGEGVIFFSAADLQRLPQGFEEEIKKIAAEKGGVLVLSEETRKMDAGFVLAYGGIEENCTLKAIFESKKEALSDAAQKVLFAQQ